ncbi:MAG: hypothetical protein K5705_06770 [Oscillospiraceae bacterium]|nr:hypothetical protein [Oscillospiraceae bacterium]
MKKIKKIAAGLMAAAIAAAGMGSLTASALSRRAEIRLYDHSAYGNSNYFIAYGNVEYTPARAYTAFATSNSSAIKFKQVFASAGAKNFRISPVSNFAYNNDTPYVTITRHSADICWFQSSYSVTARRSSGQDVTGGTAIYL